MQSYVNQQNFSLPLPAFGKKSTWAVGPHGRVVELKCRDRQTPRSYTIVYVMYACDYLLCMYIFCFIIAYVNLWSLSAMLCPFRFVICLVFSVIAMCVLLASPILHTNTYCKKIFLKNDQLYKTTNEHFLYNCYFIINFKFH